MVQSVGVLGWADNCLSIPRRCRHFAIKGPTLWEAFFSGITQGGSSVCNSVLKLDRRLLFYHNRPFRACVTLVCAWFDGRDFVDLLYWCCRLVAILLKTLRA